MTKRIIAILTAVLILAVSVPAFAADQSIPFDIVNRRDPYVCGNPWYSGDLSSAPAIVSDAISRVTAAHPGYLNLLAQIIQDDGMVTDNVADVYITYIPDLEYSLFKINHNDNGDYMYLSRPLLADTGNAQTMYRVRVRYNTISSDFDSFTFEQIFSQSSETSRNVSDVTVKSNYFNSSLFSVPWEFDTSAGGTITVPGPNCDGNFSIGIGTYSFTFPASPPIDPGYSGPASITLQPGNLLIFVRSGGFSGVDDITITANDLPISPFLGPWETRNSIGSSPTLPDDSTPLGVPYTQWSKVEGSENWLGRSTRGIYNWQISQYTDDFAFYLNPIFGFNVGGFDFIGSGSPDYNPPNVVRIPDVSAYDKIYLVPTINRAGQSYIDYSRGSVLYDVSFDDNGIPEYTPEGSDTPDSDANRPGGATDISGDSGATTQGLIARILEFLESGIDRFASVAEAGRSFLESISSIFSWIPIEIRTVLTSGIIIVIMMAVLSRFI